MTREEAIKLLEKEKEYMISHGGDLQADALGMAIKALEQEPCEDCVSRQAVLEKINDWWGITSTSGEPTLCDCIRELPPLIPTQKWIPVSERLPKEMGTYMTTIDYEEHGLVTGQRYYYGRGLKWNDECVIAWMPLPEPYKVEMESEE